VFDAVRHQLVDNYPKCAREVDLDQYAFRSAERQRDSVLLQRVELSQALAQRREVALQDDGARFGRADEVIVHRSEREKASLDRVKSLARFRGAGLTSVPPQYAGKDLIVVAHTVVMLAQEHLPSTERAAQASFATHSLNAFADDPGDADQKGLVENVEVANLGRVDLKDTIRTGSYKDRYVDRRHDTVLGEDLR
jgi:hypothetical protein